MTPIPQEQTTGEVLVSEDGSSLAPGDVVISGMSGTFPSCHNVMEWSDKLYNKVDMIEDERRWNYSHPEAPKSVGICPDLHTFDAQFFKVHRKQAITLDVMSRKLLEHAHQAIYDSGILSEELRTKKVGVFVGTSISDMEKVCFYVPIQINAFGIAGCNHAMYANRISYWLNLKGPSYAVDGSCSSSMVALERAYESIRRGDCEAAIVGSTNICFHPHVSVHYHRLGVLCDDGKTRSFDKNASGCVRADSVNCLFLQRAENAKRIYAQLHLVKSQYSIDKTSVSKDHPLGPVRPVESIRDFWDGFYKEANVSPNHVQYVEAYGVAVPAADRSELEAIGQIFCKDRKQPLPVGSVMSNMGNGEAASGVNSIMKVLLAYHTGKIASNLHFETPRDDVPALHDGRIEVVNDHRPLDRSAFAAVNSFSLGGINVHALLRGYYKKKDLDKYKTDLPRLVTVSARTDSGVKKILNHLKSHPIDAEEIRLLHNIHQYDVQGHLGRGYTILSTNDEGQTVSLAENCDYYPDLKNPVWFVYSGMGSQWAGMGAQLMRIPIFAAAIDKCCKVLEPKGVDLMRVLIDPDKTIYDNILNSFVGIAAVQIGLTDILRELGIVPDNIIGHSVGELGCAYADGCFSAEEMILAAYSRGLVSVQTPFIRGAMAAVGLGYKDILDMCPPEIEVACHNGPESSTISGPADAMRAFVQELTAKGIFAKEVPCSNIAYHSRYIAEAGPALLKYLSEVIKDPKPRSEKWVSTSVPQDKWDEEAAKYSSAEYHTNNLLRSVLFEETSRLIPSNAVVIEIAPHGLLQAILKRSLHADCVHVPLTRRGHSDAVTFFLDNIGKLYQNGLTPQLHVLYPKVEFPVSTGTPMLSHLVEWMHSERWPLPKYAEQRASVAGIRVLRISIYDQEHEYIKENVRNGVILFPEATMLVLVWETLAMLQEQSMNEVAVEFQNVRFDCDPVVHPEDVLNLEITIQKGSGYFEISHDGNCTASGNVLFPKKLIDVENAAEFEENDYLNSSDIYKLFHVKGYSYSGSLRSIHKASTDFTKAQIIWNNNWVTFIDSLLQLNTLRRNYDGISKVKHIRSLKIDQQHHKALTENNTYINAVISELGVLTKCGGVTLEDVRFINVTPYQQHSVIKRREFLPYHPVGKFDVKTALHVFVQIVQENAAKDQINIVEAIDDNQEALGDQIVAISNELININANYRSVLTKDIFGEPNLLKECDLVIAKQAISDNKMYEHLSENVSKNSFILSTETAKSSPENPCIEVAGFNTPIGRLVLSKLRATRVSNEHVSFVSAPQEVANFSFLEHTRNNLVPIQKLIVLSGVPAPPGLVDLVKKWRREPEKNNVNLILTDNKTDTDCNFNEQMNKNLSVNIYKKGVWGTECYLPNNLSETVSRHVKLQNTLPGDLDSLTWLEVPQHRINKNTVKVHYAGPSYYDVMKATGKIPSITEKDFYGMDFSGVTQSGKRVMGVVASGALASTVEPDPQFLWPVPDHWSLEDAATVPMPYMHAFYCLAIKGGIRRGLRVLIHSGAGALGQAAISIALAMDCEVFTTVSDSRKKALLKKLYPALRDDHIGYSRDVSFEQMVMSATNGEGCHLVINCLSGELREATMRCVGCESFMIDVALSDGLENKPFGMNYLGFERSYKTTNFALLFEAQDTETKKVLQSMLTEGISAGYVRPLTRVTLSAAEVQRAFRLMAGNRHRGRVLLNMADLVSLPLQPRITFSSTGSYVVVCGDHELGLELADLLVKRGVKNLAIHADQVSDGYSKLKLKNWKNQQINVQFSASNLRTFNNAVDYLKESAKLGSIQGIFVVDATDEFTSIEDSVVGNLDKAARKICPALKQFVVLRTVADNVESIAEIVCADRHANDLPGLYLSLPTVEKFDQKLELSQSVKSALDALETSLRLDYRVATSYALKKLHKCDLVEKVGKILDINIADLPDNTALKDLGVDFERAEEIRNILERLYKISYDRMSVRQLTVGKLKETQLKLMSALHVEPKGLSVYFNSVDPDELNATAKFIVMQTLVYDPDMKNDEFESKEAYVILVPGMEGHHAIFDTLCDRLKVFSLVLQPGVDNPNETVRETAERFVKLMRKMIEVDGKFYLLGYSFGALIALEMAALLEKEGLEGTVFCMDSAPDVFRLQLNATLGEMSDTQLQDSTVDHMYTVMAGESSEQLRKQLPNLSTWEEKVALGMRHLNGRVPYSTQYARSYIETAYGRIGQARVHNADHIKNNPLQSKIVLMRSKLQPEVINTFPRDFGLSKYSKQPVAVYDLELSHANAPKDLRCTGIIDRHLDPKLHEIFAQKNLCETYLPNGIKFLDVTQIE